MMIKCEQNYSKTDDKQVAARTSHEPDTSKQPLGNPNDTDGPKESELENTIQDLFKIDKRELIHYYEEEDLQIDINEILNNLDENEKKQEES